MCSTITVVSQNDQHEGSDVAVLGSTGSKGSVIVNGELVKKNTCCTLSACMEIILSYPFIYLFIFHFNAVCSSLLLFFKWELSLSNNYIYVCVCVCVSPRVSLIYMNLDFPAIKHGGCS